MKSSDTPPANRLRRLSASRRSIWSRYLAVSPIHNLRITPPSGRTSCIGSPDIRRPTCRQDPPCSLPPRKLRRRNAPVSTRPPNRIHHVVWRRNLARRRIEQHAHIPYTHGLMQRLRRIRRRTKSPQAIADDANIWHDSCKCLHDNRHFRHVSSTTVNASVNPPPISWRASVTAQYAAGVAAGTRRER